MKELKRLSAQLMLFCLAGLLSGSSLGQSVPPAPPIPPVLSIREMGTVTQNSVILGRDGTFSALFKGRSVWSFGDTAMSVPGQNGSSWDDNSLSWTTDLNASNGIDLNHDYADGKGVPAEFLPYTPFEAHYNYTHDTKHCTANPCGAEFAMWGGPVVSDPERDRILIFYTEIWRISGNSNWTTVGTGIAAGDPSGKFVRPIEAPGSAIPNLMWSSKEIAYGCGSLVLNQMLYSYGCVLDFLSMHYQLAKVPLAEALDKSQWSYYAGNGKWSANPADAVTVFDGGAAGSSVFYNPFLGEYMAIYSGVLSNDIYYRVSSTPWGTWSEQKLLLTGKTGWNNHTDYAGMAHPEFAQAGGQIQYVTYAHTTGLLRMDEPLVQVVFGNPN